MKQLLGFFISAIIVFLLAGCKTEKNPVKEISQQFYSVNDNIIVSQGSYYEVNMTLILKIQRIIKSSKWVIKPWKYCTRKVIVMMNI